MRLTNEYEVRALPLMIYFGPRENHCKRMSKLGQNL